MSIVGEADNELVESSAGSLLRPGWTRVAPSQRHPVAAELVREPVADHAETDAEENDRQPGEGCHPPGAEQDALSVSDHDAEFGGRRLNAEAQVREAREEEEIENEVPAE